MMRIVAVFLVLLSLGLTLSACGNRKPADPNTLLAPSEKVPPGPGLLTGEAGEYKVILD